MERVKSEGEIHADARDSRDKDVFPTQSTNNRVKGKNLTLITTA